MKRAELKAIIEASIHDTIALGMPVGSDERLGYVFGRTIMAVFGEREGLAIWEHIAGMPLDTMQPNDIQKQLFKNRFGVTFEESIEILKSYAKQPPELKVVK